MSRRIRHNAMARGITLLVFTLILAIMFWILRQHLKMCACLLNLTYQDHQPGRYGHSTLACHRQLPTCSDSAPL
jgi:phosphoglycerol transferase MdoB-like AlkP superfamily enzyme